MKKWMIAGLSVVMATALVACGEKKTADEGTSLKPPVLETKKETPVPEVKKDANGNVDMTVPGQQVKREDGSVLTLLSYKELGSTIDSKPVQVKVQKMKMGKWSNVSQADREFIATTANVGSTLPSEFHVFQVNYQVTSSSDKTVQFAGLTKIVLDTGEQIDADGGDIVIGNDDSDIDYNGKVTKDCIAMVYMKSDPSKVKKVKLVFSNVVTTSDFKELSPEKEIEVIF